MSLGGLLWPLPFMTGSALHGRAVDGSINPTVRDGAHGFELSEPYSDNIRPVPPSYWKGRTGELKP